MTLNVFRFTGLNSALALKAPVRCAATTNITLVGLQTIDGVLLQSSDTNLRVLVMGQSDPRQNGLYDSQSGNWTRCTDWDTNDDFVQGTRVFVSQGTTQKATTWYLSTADPVNLGTSNITFTAVPIANVSFADGTVGAPSINFAAQTTTGFYRAGSGQIGVAGSLLYPDGTSGAPSISFTADTATGFYRVGSGEIGVSGSPLLSGNQAILVQPVGNALNTGSSFVMQVNDVGTGTYPTGLEYGAVITMTTTHNGGSVGPNKVAAYFAASNNNASGGSLWSINSVNTLGASSPSGVTSQGYECDTNNLSGTARNYFNLGAAVYGISITGASTSVNTAALLLSGNTGAPQWTAGIVWNNFRSGQSAQYGVDLSFDLNNTFSVAAVRLPNNSPLAATNAAHNAVINGLLLDASNVWQLGGGNNVEITGSLGIGVAPSFGVDIQTGNASQLRVASTGANSSLIAINNVAGGNQSSIFFQDAGVSKFQIGKQTDNTFFLFDSANSLNFLTCSTGGVLSLGEGGSVGVTINTSALRYNQAPAGVSGAGPINIGSGSTINSRVSISMNGTTYWFPCSTTAF